MKRWTAYLALPDAPLGRVDEEIDVDAETEAEARLKVEMLLPEYEPGLRITDIVERFGLYL